MKLLEEKIKKWLEVDIGSGDDYGSGYDDGSGDGSGYGDGYGYSSGYGSGSGDDYGSGDGYGYGSSYSEGDGYGYGDGSGTGDGYGYGDGSGYGSGDSYGYGDGWKSINGNKIYRIDNVLTIITHLNKNVAKGKILNRDLTTEDCYVVKGHNEFSHGKTIKEAMQSLEEKIFDNMNTEETIEEFRKKFKDGRKYKGTTFFKWHHNLTGSCLMGRESFVKNNEIDLNKMYSVQEFIKLTENDFGGSVIRELKQYYK